MKKLIATTVAAVAVGWVFPTFAVETLYYWDFSSDALGEYDRVGGNDLSNANGVTISDGAAVFDGTARECVTMHNVDLRGNQPYTIECFVYAEDGMIMELSPNSSLNSYIGGFYLYSKEGVMARTSKPGYNGERFTSGTICDGQWHHVAIIVDPTTNVATDAVRLYVDGTRQTNHTHSDAEPYLSAYRLYIGSRGGASLPFKGKIDDIRITEGVLSTDQFLSTRSTGTTDVRAYWTFDNGNALADSSGNGNALQGSQGVTFANGCASFNGTASDVRTVNTLDLSDTKDMTLEFFVRRHDGADATAIAVEHSSNYNTNQQGFGVVLNYYWSQVHNVTCEFGFRGGLTSHLAPSYVVNSGWHHVAIIKDSSKAGTDYSISLYVDGVRWGYVVNKANDSDDFMRNDYLYLGSRADGSFPLDADIDDVRVTAQVLVPGQFLRKRTGSLEDVIAHWSFDKSSKMLVDASGNGNVLTGSGVTVRDGAAVFDGSQSGFATLAPLPLYSYDSLTVEWFMKSSMTGYGIVLETSSNYGSSPGAFYACANESVGYRMARTATFNIMSGWGALDGGWHHYALVYDWNSATDIVRIYRDGVRINPSTGNASPANLNPAVLYIGARNGTDYKFVGELDDIKLTGRALAPSEFMTKRSVPPGMAIIFR